MKSVATIPIITLLASSLEEPLLKSTSAFDKGRSLYGLKPSRTLSNSSSSNRSLVEFLVELIGKAPFLPEVEELLLVEDFGEL
ncbi:hypothetical protein OGAPHI_005472 [Ogataea philodendri]|uniref:Uncharacterized protein n=1 Tax=Ogataea philodendri TaxID=1378263 RepID=A0A9P8T1K2_9ASCO|nr:uncharacterized protein OGAPHI_005472 [Ogataea philodendri]KAH3662224.1 hypothetical protein OGAPHI_005472 [Ogataea philodendri]